MADRIVIGSAPEVAGEITQRFVNDLRELDGHRR